MEYIGGLAALAKTRKEVVTLEEGATVMDLLHYLSNRDSALKSMLIGEQGGLCEDLFVSANGRAITGADSVRTKLTNDDRVIFSPFLEGG